jgi:hypothetical protein
VMASAEPDTVRLRRPTLSNVGETIGGRVPPPQQFGWNPF